MTRFDGPFQTVIDQYIPPANKIKPGVIYLSTTSTDSPTYARFFCPCGCEDQVAIPLKPFWPESGWDLTLGPNNEVTFSPSLQQAPGRCGAHFHIQDGMVKWC